MSEIERSRGGGLPARLSGPPPEDPEIIDVEVHVLSERRMTDWLGLRLAFAALARSSLGLVLAAVMAVIGLMLVLGSSVLTPR